MMTVSRAESRPFFPSPSENLCLNPSWLYLRSSCKELERHQPVHTSIDNWDWQKWDSVSRCSSTSSAQSSEARSPLIWGWVERGQKKEVPALEDQWILGHEAMRNEGQWTTAFPWNHSALIGMAPYKEWKKIFFDIERQGRTKLILSTIETKRNWKLSCLKGILSETFV